MPNDKKRLTPEIKERLNEKIKEKMDDDKGVDIDKVKGKAYTELSDEEQANIAKEVIRELDESEAALSEILMQYPDIKKAYLDNEKRDDPFYIDYNLFFNNVDMSMALSYANEPKVIFQGTNSSDASNADAITKNFEYEYREEMDMDLSSYELAMDKHIGGVGCVFREYDEETNTPIPKVCPTQYFRPDPLGRGHEKRYRYMGRYGRMTKQQMRDNGDFMNIEQVIDTDRTKKESSDKNNNGSGVSITPNGSNDESAYFAIYTHLRTKEDGRKCLVTLANGGTLVVRYVELDYQIGGKRVFPVSMDFWKPKPGYPLGVLMRFLTGRKQKVLSLLLNLAVKKAIRSSLGNHIIVDEAAIKNKNQLRQLTEFPEIILVDTNNGAKNVNNIVSELQHSQVPQDNYNTEERIKQLNYEETSIGPNQLGISPTGDQTATEIKDNAANSSVRLSLPNRISMIFWKDFCRKRLMMHQYHYPDNAKKQITISREFGDRYMTFERKYLDMSGDPHLKIESKFDLMQKNKQLFANHVVLYSYIQQLASAVYTPLSVRLAMRKALRLLGYEEDEILDYIEESAEEREAKEHLRLLNKNIKLEPLTPDQIDEHHKDYLHVYKQAKTNDATKAAVLDRIKMQKAQDQKNIQLQKAQMLQQGGAGNTNGMQNQMTNNMISQQNQQGQGLKDLQPTT